MRVLCDLEALDLLELLQCRDDALLNFTSGLRYRRNQRHYISDIKDQKGRNHVRITALPSMRVMCGSMRIVAAVTTAGSMASKRAENQIALSCERNARNQSALGCERDAKP
jgi:hypothetical protein